MEIAFWQALDHLAAQVRPATLGLLQGAQRSQGHHPGPMRRHVLYYQLGSIELDTYLNRKQASYDILAEWRPSSFLPPLLTFSDLWSSTTAKASTEIEIRFTLQAIQLYLLPLCYGLLGAFTYLLRSLTREMRDWTWLAENKVNYRLRLCSWGPWRASLSPSWSATTWRCCSRPWIVRSRTLAARRRRAATEGANHNYKINTSRRP